MEVRRTGSSVARTVVLIVAFATVSVLITPSAWAAVPQITSFSPASGPLGTVVTITGTGFGGAPQVDFTAGASAMVSAASDTQITAMVPLGATSGPISVTGP